MGIPSEFGSYEPCVLMLNIKERNGHRDQILALLGLVRC